MLLYKATLYCETVQGMAIVSFDNYADSTALSSSGAQYARVCQMRPVNIQDTH